MEGIVDHILRFCGFALILLLAYLVNLFVPDRWRRVFFRSWCQEFEDGKKSLKMVVTEILVLTAVVYLAFLLYEHYLAK